MAGATVVAVYGEIDLAAQDRLRAALGAALAAAGPVVVDLSGCTFMDSTGLHALLDARERAEQRRVALVLSCLPDQAPAQLLNLAVPTVFEVHPSRSAALQALAA